MNLRALVIGAAIVSFGGGCGAPADSSDAASSDSAIIGGTDDAGDPSVVLLDTFNLDTYAGSLCTASVIGQTVLLTAAHCVAPSAVGKNLQITAYLGSNFEDPNARTFRGIQTHYDHAFDIKNLNNGHDIAVVILESPIPLAPLPINRAVDSATMVGQTVRLVGYGANNAESLSGSGHKRTVSLPIKQVTQHLIQIEANGKGTCAGDSGGPTLAMINGVETIVGITSFHFGACVSQGSYYTRVELYRDFLDRYLNPDPAGPPPSAPDPPDPNEPPPLAATSPDDGPG